MLLSQALFSSAAIGLGCGAGCGSAASAFLMTYIMTEGKTIAYTLKQVAIFYLGKLLAVITLCISASAAGRVIIREDGSLAGFPLSRAVSFMILLCSIWLIYGWFKERKGCHACRHCQANVRTLPSFAVGIAYGLSPCAPLMLVLGYSIVLSIPGAILLAVVFTMASSILPALLTLGLAGLLSVNISLQLGKYLPAFQLVVYIMYLIIGFSGVL